jgi:hypothetical protein
VRHLTAEADQSSLSPKISVIFGECGLTVSAFSDKCQEAICFVAVDTPAQHSRFCRSHGIACETSGMDGTPPLLAIRGLKIQFQTDYGLVRAVDGGRVTGPIPDNR